MSGDHDVVHDSLPALRRPRRLVAGMWRDLLAALPLARIMVLRDLKAQYRASFLGYIWAFVPPLVTAFALTAASRGKAIDFGTSQIPYPAYALIGITLWQTFFDALSGPVAAVGQARFLLARIAFPRETLVLVAVGTTLFNFMVRLLLIAACFAWFGLLPSSQALVGLAAVGGLILLGTLFGVLLAPLSMISDDVTRGLSILGMVWMLASPVIYVPRPGSIVAAWTAWNPVAPLLTLARDAATVGDLAALAPSLWISAAALLGLFVSWVVFRLAVPYAVERISA